MCWNTEVSLNTFIFSLFATLFAYFNNVIGGMESLYFFSFMSMQLLEYFTWKNLKDRKMNTFLSKVGLFLIFIQIPLFILHKSNVPSHIKMELVILYLMFSLFVKLHYSIDFSMNKASNGHLAWNWLNFPGHIIIIYLSFILGLLFYEKEYFKFIVYFVVIFAIYYTYDKTNTWGSLWCWISNVLALKLICQVFLKSTLPNCLLFDKNSK